MDYILARPLNLLFERVPDPEGRFAVRASYLRSAKTIVEGEELLHLTHDRV